MPTDLLADDLSIGELSSISGLSIHTLRYYEKIGLFAPVPRHSSGHRRYHPDTVHRAEALSYLRAAGMSVEDMRGYVAGVDRGDDGAADLAALLARHAERIGEEIGRLEIRREYIAAKARYWQAVADGDAGSEAAQGDLVRARELSGQLR